MELVIVGIGPYYGISYRILGGMRTYRWYCETKPLCHYQCLDLSSLLLFTLIVIEPRLRSTYLKVLKSL